MRKKFLIISLALMALMSCEKISDDSETSKSSVNLVFNVLSVEQTDYDGNVTRGSLNEAIKSLDFVVYELKNGVYTLYKSVQQESENSDFGSISLENVTYGSYIIVAVGHKCSVHATFYSPSKVDFGGKVAETFVAYMPLEVNYATASSQSLTMNRITGKFVINATDAQPSNVATVEFLISNGAAEFNPSTGLAFASSSEVRTVIVDASTHAGETNLLYSFNTFLPQNEATISVIVNFKDLEGKIIYTHSFDSAPMKVNRQTIYSGEVYAGSKPNSFAIAINDSWEEDLNLTL